jgi:hypothetical protein
MRLNSLKITALVVLSVLLLLILAAGAIAAPPWSDAPASWWVESYGITEAQVATLADGFPDGTFRPSVAVTRGQFAKMAVSGLGVDTADPATPSFRDVAKGGTFYIYVEGAYAAELITGYTTTAGRYFRPANTITRQQAISILGRYLSDLEIDATGVIHGTLDNYGTLQLWYQAEGEFWLGGAFEDSAGVAADHRATTAYLRYRDIVKGSNNKLNPTATLARAQAAALILRVKTEAIDILTPPDPPTNLGVAATGSGMQVTQTGPTSYVGNDPSPRVTGDTLVDSNIAIYDTPFFGTTYIKLDKSNLSGKFFTDLNDSTKPLVDGTHSFTAKVQNANGLVSAASDPVTYILDTVLPAGSITEPVLPGGQDFVAVNLAKPAFAVTATDERSGVKNVQFQVSPVVSPRDWETISTDAAPDSGTMIYRAVWPATGDLGAGLSDGDYEFRALITDMAGNVRTIGPLEVLVDTVAPTVAITAPVAVGTAFVADTGTPAFTATATDPAPAVPGSGDDIGSGIATVEFLYVPWATPLPTTWAGFTLLSSDFAPDPGTSTYHASYASALPDGRYLFAVRATDRAGNQSVLMSGSAYKPGVTQEVIIDRTAPTGSITAPAAGWHTSLTPPPFTVTAADGTGSGVTEVAFQYATGATPGTWTTLSADTTIPYAADWGSLTLTDGETYHLRAIITDAADNSYTTSTVVITVDATAPTGTITAPAAGTVTVTQPTFTATASDAGSGVKQVIFQWSTSASGAWIPLNTDTGSPYEADWGTTELEDGNTYYLRVEITDNAGNPITVGPVEITVDLP